MRSTTIFSWYCCAVERPRAAAPTQSTAMATRMAGKFTIRAMRTLFGLLFVTTSAFAARFADVSLDKTMRVNYFHTGNHGQEIIALDSVVSDGPWPGSRSRLIDTMNLGNYFFEVVDRETNQPVYSRGFASVFGEWVTTGEAKDRAGTFWESVRFPRARQT